MTVNLEEVAANLKKRGFEAIVCRDKEAALEFISSNFLTLLGTKIGIGNSMTLRQLNLLEIARQNGRSVHARSPENMSNEDARAALTADLYFTSANALSIDGRIVNIDGTGNRVSASIFGPDKVIFVIGKNKIAPSLDAAIERARNAAAKLAAKYSRKTPCAITGKCEECLSPESICAVMAIYRKAPAAHRTWVILVDEDLGL